MKHTSKVGARWLRLTPTTKQLTKIQLGNSTHNRMGNPLVPTIAEFVNQWQIKRGII